MKHAESKAKIVSSLPYKLRSNRNKFDKRRTALQNPMLLLVSIQLTRDVLANNNTAVHIVTILSD